jgi:hypothetical protein
VCGREGLVWHLAMPLSMAVHQYSQYKKAFDAAVEHWEQSAPCHRISFLLTRLRSGAWFSKNSHLGCLLLFIQFGCGHIMVVMGWCYKNGGGGATRRRRGGSWSFGGGGNSAWEPKRVLDFCGPRTWKRWCQVIRLCRQVPSRHISNGCF